MGVSQTPAKRRAVAMALACKRGRVANRDLQALFPGVTGETIRKDLAHLVTEGRLVRHGYKRGTFYTCS